LALENSGKNEVGSGFSVFFQARQEMKKKGIVEVGDDQICLWERSPKSVLDVKYRSRGEAVHFGVPLGFLNRGGIKIPTDCLHAELCASESENS
jgi:hypothetical protein